MNATPLQIARHLAFAFDPALKGPRVIAQVRRVIDRGFLPEGSANEQQAVLTLLAVLVSGNVQDESRFPSRRDPGRGELEAADSMTRVKYIPAGPPYELGEQAPLILFTQVGPNGGVLRVYNATPPLGPRR